MFGPRPPAYSIGQAPRLSSSIQETPGPATYLISKDLIKGLSFTKSPRSPKAACAQPGPGDYNQPSFIGQGPKPIIISRRLRRLKESGPGPADYSPQVIEKTVKYTFRKSLDTNILSSVPGPGTYSPTSMAPKSPNAVIGRAKRSYSNSQISPGPGTYNTERLNRSKEFSFTKAPRDRYYKETGPGPSDYSPKSGYTITGSAKISSSSMTPMRPATSKERTPGPGAYNNEKLLKSSPKWTIAKAKKSGSPVFRKFIRKRLKRNELSESTQITSHDKINTVQTSRRRLHSSENFEVAPGPGDYSPIDIKKKQPSAVFGTAKKWKPKVFKTPGPADYSSHQAPERKGFTFPKELREKNLKLTGPGPGCYEIPHTIGSGFTK